MSLINKLNLTATLSQRNLIFVRIQLLVALVVLIALHLPFSVVAASLVPETDPQCQPVDLPVDRELVNFQSLRTLYPMEQYEGVSIGKISIVTLPIFNEHDENENNVLYRFINRIHPPTQHYVIKRQLLVSEGDQLQVRLLNESERILRDSEYLSDAAIVPHQICGESLDLLVVVREVWTLLPKLFFSRKGGDNKYGLTLEDENILGSGNTLFLQFIHDRERDTTAVGYRTKQFLGTRVTLSAIYSDTTDGINKTLEVARPFYSFDTPWSLGVKFDESVFEESLEALNQPISNFRHFENEYQVYAGYSQGLIDNHTQRYTLGLTRTEDLFETIDNIPATLPTDRVLAYPWLQYSIAEDNFAIYKNLNALYRTEDVPIGIEFSALLGYADKAFDSELSHWVFDFNYSATPLSGKKHLIKSDLSMEGFWDREIEDFTNTLSTIELSYYWLMAKKHRAFVKIAYDHGTNLTQDHLLPLGGEEGLRGYPNEYLLGDERLLINIEHRYFFDAHYMNLFRFAGVIFIDVGQTKFDDSNAGDNNDVISSAGIGLRMNSSKATINRIAHIDLAFPLNDKGRLDEYQLRITSSSTF